MDLFWVARGFREHALAMAIAGRFGEARRWQKTAAKIRNERRAALRECSWCGAKFRPPADDPQRQQCSAECYRYENGPGEWFPPAGS